MEVYLVGGAVRDELLGIAVKERDWVVVGSTPEEMLKQGYKQVGKDFPVFLHPHSKEEFALARTERKKGRGYYGFEVHTSPTVTLEEDLQRRDLTINAIAKSKTEDIIDPYGGQQDLNNKVLRHVSDAFTEDPLRVLRVARFAATLHPLGFTIADDTLKLMRHIVRTGELNDLAPERIWKETQIALTTQSPCVFFSILQQVRAIAQTHTGISDVFEDKSSRELGFASLNEITSQETDPCVRFAAMLGGLFYTKQDAAYGAVQKLTKQLPLSRPCKEVLSHTANLQHQCHQVLELDEKQLLSLVTKFDARRKPDRFKSLLKIFSSIYKVATNEKTYPQANWVTRASNTIEGIDIDAWIRQGVNSKQLADNIENTQLELLQQLIEKRTRENKN